MKAVQDVQRLGTLLTNHVQIGLPHIRTDEFDLRGELVTDHSKEALEGCDSALFAHPQEPGEPLVDLVHQGQVLVAPGVLDFVHPDGADRRQDAMLQAPVNHVFDGIADLVPRSVERLGGLLPGELAGPPSQKQHVGFGRVALAITPGDFFHQHPGAAAALDTPHRLQEENQKTPERDEFKAPFGKMVVTGRRLMASRANGR